MEKPDNGAADVRKVGGKPLKDNLDVIPGGTPKPTSPEESNTTPGTTEPDEKPQPIQSDDQKKTA